MPAAAQAAPDQPVGPLSFTAEANSSALTGEGRLQRIIPKELLRKLEHARNSGDMLGERRVVTMLFCDVKGSTAAADQLDPEDWTEIMNGAFEQMIRPVYDYEGTVARLMGDALLAFFGAPIAHEDDPQRAILAGLEIVQRITTYRAAVQERFAVNVDIRVGINTGLVVVGAVGSDLRMEYSALGDAINVAARMEQSALPGTVQVAHDTYKLTKPFFDFEPLGSMQVKGKPEPILTYRPGARKLASAQVRGIEGLHAEIVDRQSELLALRQIMSDLRQGLGRIVCVLGDAGLGKTRLVSEARRHFAEAAGPGANWHEASSLSYESHQAYGLFRHLLQHVIGIDYADPPEVVRQKLVSLIHELEPARQPGASQVFEALLGIKGGSDQPLDGDVFRHQLLEAMDAWWRTVLSRQPTVLLFDDMHWADAASVELLKRLLPLTEQLPLVLLCVMRTERQSFAWQIKTTADADYHHRYTEVVLHPFTDSESNELIDRLLGSPDIPESLRLSILEKSGGNPFFIEEVLRTLIESGALVPEARTLDGETRRSWRAGSAVVDFDVPDNLQSLLSARMDRLEEGTRATLQLASVVGRSFYHRILKAVDEGSQELDKHLGTLVKLDLIREAARVPELAYAFRNPLTQEAVYNTILVRRRREFHRRVGEAIEALYSDRLDALVGLLAHHFTMAGAREPAIQYSRLASRQARALFAFEDAVRPLRAALQLLKPDERTPIRLTLLEELADVHRLLRDGAQALPLYIEALDLARDLSEGLITTIRLHRKIVQFVIETKWSVSLDYFQQANELATESRSQLEQLLGDLPGDAPHAEYVRALAVLSYDAWRSRTPPDWERARRFAQAAVGMAEDLDDATIHSRALGALARVLDGQSLLGDHLEIARQRLELEKQNKIEEPGERIDILSGMGMALMYVGEYQAAIPHLQQAATLAREVQAVAQHAAALGLQQQCLFRMDRWDELLPLEEEWRFLEQHYTRARVGATCFAVAMMASVHAHRGDRERALQYAEESLNYMMAVSGPPQEWQRNQFY
ncbi:MAG: adenylate/guanylate cyclase domain-containing protein [Chloroflexota bacterium]